MTIVSAHKSDTGRKRKRNEDYLWVDETTRLFIVADGMGGHEAGDVASQLAATTVGESITTELREATEPISSDTIGRFLRTAIETANATVFNAAKNAGQKRQMGTTIVVALIRPPTAYISHVGDARAYLARGSTLMQLTQDDSWKAQFGTKDPQTQVQFNSKFDHILTKVIGQDSQLDPSLIQVQLVPADWLLLCSDGLWNMVEDDQILAELQNAGDNPVCAVEGLVEAANESGGKDNISVVALKLLPT